MCDVAIRASFERSSPSFLNMISSDMSLAFMDPKGGNLDFAN